jgi:GNAT superfamily N-acetyltransferase
VPVDLAIRSYDPADTDGILALSIRAWEPVHDSLRRAMGEELFDSLYRGDWRAQQRRDVEAVLLDESMRVWVAETDGEMVGFAAAIVREAGHLGEVVMVAVDPPFQHRGAGTHLTNVATGWLREAGCTVAVIATGGDEGHARARATYAKAGYTPLPAVNYFKALRSPSSA